jgi:competence protein ComGC
MIHKFGNWSNELYLFSTIRIAVLVVFISHLTYGVTPMTRRAFVLTDLIVLVVLALLLAGLLFPAVLASREVARRRGCENRLRVMGVALRQYNDVYSVLPCHKFGPGSQNRISALTILLPYLGYENV